MRATEVGAPTEDSLPDHGTLVTRNATLLVASTTVGKLSAMIVAVALARLLGPGDLGLYAFALAIANFASLIPRYGFHALVTRDVARNLAVASHYLADILVLKSALSAVAVLVTASVLSFSGSDFPRRAAVSLSVAMMLMESFLDFFCSFYRARHRLEYEAGLQTSLAIFHTVVGVTVLALGYGLLVFLVWRLVGHAIGAAVAYVLLTRTFVRPAFGFRLPALKDLLYRAFPLAVVSFFVTTYVRIDIILLAFFQGDATTGWYSAAQRPVGIFAFLPAAFVGAVLPVMSDTRHTAWSLARCYERTVKYLLVLALPLAIGLGVLADQVVLLLYGPAYAPAAPALRILAWSLVVTFVNHGTSTCLVAMQQERRFMTIVAWAAVFNLVTNVGFIPWLGHVGASLTTLGTELLVMVLGFHAIRHRLNDVSLFSSTCRPALAGLIMGVLLATAPVQSLALRAGIGALSYLGALLAVGALQRQELTLAIRTIVTLRRSS